MRKKAMRKHYANTKIIRNDSKAMSCLRSEIPKSIAWSVAHCRYSNVFYAHVTEKTGQK